MPASATYQVVIQSKNRRLRIGLIGQVIVSRDLVERLGVKFMKSVGVCTEMDTVMHRILRKHPKLQGGSIPSLARN